MTEAQLADPAVHRRRLRSELRTLREAASLGQKDVATLMDWSLSKLLRIETGAVRINTNELRVLLSHYGVTDEAKIEVLVELARAGREQSWWTRYKGLVAPDYISLLGFESSASIVRNFTPLLVPGLLQTEEYAREVITTVEGLEAGRKRIDQLIELRLERQERIFRQQGTALHFILDEAVLHRAVGGVDVMQRQLRHLKSAAEQPRTTIRVVSFRTGIYPALRAPYLLLEFADSEVEDILYIEGPRGDMVIRESSAEEEEEGTSVAYLEIFWQLEQSASEAHTAAFIDRAAADLLREDPSSMRGAVAS
jgi:transcriptional regulator with XRE-family HTH domain